LDDHFPRRYVRTKDTVGELTAAGDKIYRWIKIPASIHCYHHRSGVRSATAADTGGSGLSCAGSKGGGEIMANP
jgi:hypothetical protein